MKKNTRNGILFCFLFMFSLLLNAQYVKKWEIRKPTNKPYTYSYNMNSINILKTLRLRDGSFVTLGGRRKEMAEIGDEIFLLNFDSLGTILWEYTYESPKGINEFPYDMVVDSEDNIYIVGKSSTYLINGFENNLEYSNILLLKLNSEGELVWQNQVEKDGKTVDYCASIVIDSTYNMYALCKINKILRLLKYNVNGIKLWDIVLGNDIPVALGIEGDKIRCITNSYDKNPSIFSVGTNGDILDSFSIFKWNRLKPKFDAFDNVYQFHFFGEYKLVKLDSMGNLVWTYHKPTNLPLNVIADATNDCTFDEDGNVYITGVYFGKFYGDSLRHSGCDILTTKLDSNGETIWEDIYKFDNRPNICQSANVVKVLADNYLAVGGFQAVEKNGNTFFSTDIVMLIYDEFGNRVDSIYYNSVYDREDYVSNINQVGDDLYMFGYSQNDEGLFDMIIVKYEKQSVKAQDKPENDMIGIYPNPTMGQVQFCCSDERYDLKLLGLDGKLVLEYKDFALNQTLELPESTPVGFYVIELSSGRAVVKFKIFKSN
jgi:hypothetical protein